VRLAAALGLACAVVAAGAAPECAYACSCAPVEPEEALARADAAFVGTLVERKEPRGAIVSSGDPVTLVFAVERTLKGELGERVDVATVRDSASCGIQADVGQTIGLFLERDGERWTSGLCSQLAAESAGWTGYAPLADEDDDGSSPAPWLGIGAALLALGGILALRRRESRARAG
jgi:MYXO-CTERM domain-containing protein